MTDTRLGEPSAQEEDNIRQIAESGLFDVAWYLAQTDAQSAADNPIFHYLINGGKLSPGPHFDGAWYLRHHEDVRAAGINPLLHYVKYGQSEGRPTRVVVPDRLVVKAERLVKDNEPLDVELHAQQLDARAIPYARSFHNRGTRAWDAMFSQLQKSYEIVLFSSHDLEAVIPALQSIQRGPLLSGAAPQPTLVITTSETHEASMSSAVADVVEPRSLNMALSLDDLYYIYSALLIALRPKVIIDYDCVVARRLLNKQGRAFARDSALIGILTDLVFAQGQLSYATLINLRDTLPIYQEFYVDSTKVRDTIIAALKIPPEVAARIHVLDATYA